MFLSDLEPTKCDFSNFKTTTKSFLILVEIWAYYF